MLGVNHLSGFGGGGGGERLIEIITRLGLTTNLKLCLDAGDRNSYTSGDKWLDVAGSGYDFHRGADATTDGTEPTFNGTVGGLSANEYWSFDGGDYFTYDTTNEAWMDNMHQDGAQFSVLFVMASTTVGTVSGLWGNNAGSTSNIGASGQNAGSVTFHFWSATTGAPGVADAFNADFKQAADGNFHTLGLTINEPGGADASFWVYDGVLQNSEDAAYSSPSPDVSSYPLQIGAQGNANEPMQSDQKLMAVSFWEGTSFLSAANFASIHNALIPRLT